MRSTASSYSASALSVLTAADECPDRLALIFNDQPFMYRDLAEKTAVAMAWLRLQFGPWDGLPASVALITEHRLETFVLLYALIELGIPAILLSARLTPSERQQVIDDSGAQAAVLDEQWTLPTRGYVEGQAGSLSTWVDPERPLALIHTSGVTGRPKTAIPKSSGIPSLRSGQCAEHPSRAARSLVIDDAAGSRRGGIDRYPLPGRTSLRGHWICNRAIRSAAYCGSHCGARCVADVGGTDHAKALPR